MGFPSAAAQVVACAKPTERRLLERLNATSQRLTYVQLLGLPSNDSRIRTFVKRTYPSVLQFTPYPQNHLRLSSGGFVALDFKTGPAPSALDSTTRLTRPLAVESFFSPKKAVTIDFDRFYSYHPTGTSQIQVVLLLRRFRRSSVVRRSADTANSAGSPDRIAQGFSFLIIFLSKSSETGTK